MFNNSNYKWRAGSRFSGDPNEVAKVFHDIEREYGKIDPEIVVHIAKNPESPLHKHFEWNDEKAAEEWRKQIARVLISSIVTYEIIQDQPVYRKGFEFVESAGYVSFETIVENVDYRKQLLSQAKEELRTFRIKYRNLKFIFDHINEIIAVIDQELEPVQ